MGMSIWECPESVSGHGMTDVRGHCLLCGRKIDRAQAKPERYNSVSDQTIYYDYYYDPDFDSYNYR